VQRKSAGTNDSKIIDSVLKPVANRIESPFGSVCTFNGLKRGVV